MNNLTVRTITTEVANYYQVNEDEVFTICRKGELIKCKHIAIYFVKQYTNLTLSGIGNYFPGRNGRFDHASVLHAVNSVKNQYETNRLYRAEIDDLVKRLDNMIEDARDVYDEVYMENDFYLN